MKQTDTYDPVFFQQIKQSEGEYFWFQIRRKWIFNKMKKIAPPPSTVLEVGCGTGNVSSFLASKGYSVVGSEYYTEALKISWPGFIKVQGNAENLPFKDGIFDCVGLFDVIEHFENDNAPLKEAVRVLKKGGFLIITAPAREELWSWVDEVSLHKRRYTTERINRIFSQLNLESLLVEYMFMSLYIPMKYLRRNQSKTVELFKINKILNIVLTYFFHLEIILSKIFSLPTGTSIIGIAQKKIN